MVLTILTMTVLRLDIPLSYHAIIMQKNNNYIINTFVLTVYLISYIRNLFQRR